MVQNELYIIELINFLRTVSIKNTFIADMRFYNEVNPAFQSRLPIHLTPYYRNLRGEYVLKEENTIIDFIAYPNSVVYTKWDKLMFINSLDTKEKIPFTKESLMLHTKTQSLYRIPSSYFFKLVNNYPLQADLIKNILHPPFSDVDVYAADNFSLLGYDLSLLRKNERVSMVSKMEKVVAEINRRWAVKEYCFEDLYPVVHQDIVWNILFLALFAQRIINIKTSSAHEFHVWEYLKSKGLADYRDTITENQALFLYRNINYLLKHKGTQKNFSILIGSLLNELNVTLYSKSIIQTLTVGDNQEDGLLPLSGKAKSARRASAITLRDNFSNTSKPGVKVLVDRAGDIELINQAASLVKVTSKSANSKPIDVVQLLLQNNPSPEIRSKLQELNKGSIETLDSLFKKERDSSLEYQPTALFDRATAKQTKQFESTPHTVLATKIHEINKNVESKLWSAIYVRFITDSIFYKLSLNQLKFNVIFLLPDEANSIVSVTVNEAIALLLYCSAKENGISLTEAPKAVQLEYGYKSTFSPIPKTFKHMDTTLKTESFLTAAGFVDMQAHNENIASPEQMSELFDTQAMNFLSNYFQIARQASLIPYEIIYHVYQDRIEDIVTHEKRDGKPVEVITPTFFPGRLAKGIVSIDLLNNKSYSNFFEDNEILGKYIDEIDHAVDKRTLFSQLFFSIMEKLYTFDSKYNNESETKLTNKYKKLKDLFVSMSSYNITLIDKVAGVSNETTSLPDIIFHETKPNHKINYTWCTHFPELKHWLLKYKTTDNTMGLNKEWTIEARGPVDVHTKYVWDFIDYSFTTNKIKMKILYGYDKLVPKINGAYSPTYLLRRIPIDTTTLLDYDSVCGFVGTITGDICPFCNRNVKDIISMNMPIPFEKVHAYDIGMDGSGDIPKAERTKYYKKLIIEDERTKIALYFPYNKPKPFDGMWTAILNVDTQYMYNSGAITPVYLNGVLQEIIIDKSAENASIKDLNL